MLIIELEYPKHYPNSSILLIILRFQAVSLNFFEVLVYKKKVSRHFKEQIIKPTEYKFCRLFVICVNVLRKYNLPCQEIHYDVDHDFFFLWF